MQIEHRGIVERIMPHAVVVSVVQETACAACAAVALCHSSEKKEKTMTVTCANTSTFQVGQAVTIVGAVGLGLRATLWAYVIPLMLLMIVLLSATRFTGSEGMGALIAVASLVPYYFILYLLRNKMQRKFTFSIKEDTY